MKFTFDGNDYDLPDDPKILQLLTVLEESNRSIGKLKLELTIQQAGALYIQQQLERLLPSGQPELELED